MKKIIITLICMLPVLGIGQTTTENYVKTTAYQVATETPTVSDEQKIENITYFDGLGRPKQSIAVKAGGNKENIVSHTEYDAMGRSPKQYLPYATAPDIPNPLAFTSSQTLKTEIGNFYNTLKYENTQNPYSQTVFEASVLSRAFEQAAPGNSWALSEGHTIKMDYQINLDNEVYYYHVSFSGGNTTLPQLILNGFYQEGELRKNVTKDENWTSTSGNDHTTEEFTNKLGQVVLKRTYNDNLPHDTYYTYDDFGNLTFVLSPEASDQIIDVNNTLVTNYQDILDKLGYQYKYDYRNRLIEKKVPAKGWEYIVYNKLDQPVLTQDARLRENNQWLLTKYDELSRVAYTGIVTSSESRQWQQNTANNLPAYSGNVYEQRSANTQNIAGTLVNYSNQSFPVTNITEVLTVNYYDSYVDHSGITLPSSVYNQNITSATQGLPTVSKVRVLGTNDWITSVTGYDDKARPIFGASINNYLGTTDTSESLLDFTGKVLESRTTHQKNGHQEVVIKDFFSYDHQNRLVTHMQQIDSEPVQLIASNSYDNLGQLESKRVGGQLFESGYTDIVNVTVTDNIIEKTSGDSNYYNAGLSTVGRLEGDGGISFTAETENKRYLVGLNDQSTSSSHSEVDYGFAMFWQNPPRFISQIRENGTLVSLHGATPYTIGDTFEIEREGNVIHFIHNGTEVATHTMAQNYASLVGDISMRDEGAKIGNLNLYATSIDKSLQKVDYEYNVRGWLTDINPLNSFQGGSGITEVDLFNFHINYDSPLEGTAGDVGLAIPLYNGNISQTIWKTANSDSQKRGYGYTYDALNRFKAAYSRKGTTLLTNDNFQVFDVGYDRNGNILNLKRNGTNENDVASRMDDLTYTYDGNQLLDVSDGSLTSIKNQGFYDGNTSGNDYIYDVNGNMTADKNKGITTIDYNHLNLPIFIDILGTDANSTFQKGSISYVYDATGVKQAKIVQDDGQGITITTSYAGGYIYENNDGLEKLKMISHPEGYVEPVHNTSKSVQKFSTTTQTSSFSGYQYAFNYTDHLGNVRLTYADSDGDGAINPNTEIISEKNFYPFGLQQKGYNDVVTSNSNPMAEKFAFGGKEYGEELGLDWYDISARNYDPAIGRWMNLDPLAEKMRRHSPYNFAFNNPIYWQDYDGMSPTGPGDPPKEETHSNGITTSFTYDDKGETKGTDKVMQSVVSSTTLTDDNGQVSQIIEKTVTTTTYVDAEGKIVDAEGNEGSATQTTYASIKTKRDDGKGYDRSDPIMYSTTVDIDESSMVSDEFKETVANVQDFKKSEKISPVQAIGRERENISTIEGVASVGLGVAAMLVPEPTVSKVLGVASIATGVDALVRTTDPEKIKIRISF
ncbi:DUF6443 domain-containing protein [Dokdonia ponticola]|uniref:DUF6443 domain-containing protein n=1 Tax=Dokdonia ponticola TaxID=2041041 RepID=A0ABV9HS33_9FLAO